MAMYLPMTGKEERRKQVRRNNCSSEANKKNVILGEKRVKQ
jgi:hypothetical protein